MKLTKSILKDLIKEEIEASLKEQDREFEAPQAATSPKLKKIKESRIKQIIVEEIDSVLIESALSEGLGDELGKSLGKKLGKRLSDKRGDGLGDELGKLALQGAIGLAKAVPKAYKPAPDDGFGNKYYAPKSHFRGHAQYNRGKMKDNIICRGINPRTGRTCSGTLVTAHPAAKKYFDKQDKKQAAEQKASKSQVRAMGRAAMNGSKDALADLEFMAQTNPYAVAILDVIYNTKPELMPADVRARAIAPKAIDTDEFKYTDI